MQSINLPNLGAWPSLPAPTQTPYFGIGGTVANGLNDDANAINIELTRTPVGGTIALTPGRTYLIGSSLVIPRGMTFDMRGAVLKAKAGSGIVDMISVSDISNVYFRGGIIDCNNTALAGIHATARSAAPNLPSIIEFDGVRVINMAASVFPDHGGITVDSADSGATFRYQRVRAINCSAVDGGLYTPGMIIVYADYVDVENWRGENLGFHSFEFIGCTNANATTIRSKNCAGSGAAVGDHSKYFELSDIVCENCSGDAAISIENTSSFGKVLNWRAIDCAKPAISVSYTTAGVYPNDVVRNVEVSHGIAIARTLSIAAISKAVNAVITTTVPHRLNWDTVIGGVGATTVAFSGIAGMLAMNGLTGQVTIISPTQFSVPINSTGFATYTGGGTVSMYTPGINSYGSSPNFAQGIRYSDIDINSFNRAIDIRYTSGVNIHDIRCSELTGPLSYIGLFQEIQKSQISDISCSDTRVSSNVGAFQFLSFGGIFCDDVEVSGLYAWLCQLDDLATFTPVVYLEGNGAVYFKGIRTASALNYLSVPAASSPTVMLIGSMGIVTSAYIGGAGTPNVIQETSNYAGVGDKVIIGQASALLSGNGVPAAGLGANGDSYFRRDGGAGSYLYQKVAGAWVARA